MFTPRDSQLRISRRRTNQKTSRSPVFAIGRRPRFCKTRCDRHSYQKLGLTSWNCGRHVLSNRSTTPKIFVAETWVEFKSGTNRIEQVLKLN
jgi:hypothetical protein